MNDTYLTLPEVAKALKVSVDTIRRAIKRGELPQTKVGPFASRLRECDVEHWLFKLRSRNPRP